mmetsp:Transcript_46669/g.129723  ORF Transcript_46669/g.129723 Transcript_46669/m.129723 type:complete len:219 (+) Transcript_46669:140-796(+)
MSKSDYRTDMVNMDAPVTSCRLRSPVSVDPCMDSTVALTTMHSRRVLLLAASTSETPVVTLTLYEVKSIGGVDERFLMKLWRYDELDRLVLSRLHRGPAQRAHSSPNGMVPCEVRPRRFYRCPSGSNRRVLFEKTCQIRIHPAPGRSHGPARCADFLAGLYESDRQALHPLRRGKSSCSGRVIRIQWRSSNGERRSSDYKRRKTSSLRSSVVAAYAHE